MRGQLIDSQIVRLMQTAPVWTVSDVRSSLPRYSTQKVRGSLIRLRTLLIHAERCDPGRGLLFPDGCGRIRRILKTF